MKRFVVICFVILGTSLWTGCGLGRAEDPDGSEGDRAALARGYLLTRQQQPDAALDSLRRGSRLADFSGYARLVLARAVVDGEITDAYAEATDAVARLLDSDEIRPQAREEAAFLFAVLGFLSVGASEAIQRAEEFLERYPKSPRRHEVRWRSARARLEEGDVAEAHSTFESIWYDSPESPWASEARDVLRRLESENDLAPRELSAEEHYELIQALRRAGLHGDAVREIDLFVKRRPRPAKSDEVLLLQAMSLYVLRKNDACVAAVLRLWREFPRSEHRQAAAIYAIRARRRSDSTGAVRTWVERIRRLDPRHERAIAALYELGTYLANVVDIDEGIRTLELLAETGGEHPAVRDSLWKIAWYERRRGRTERSVEALGKLLAEYPDSGYRAPALYWSARFLETTEPELAVEHYRTCWRESPHDYYGHAAHGRLFALGVEPGATESSGVFPVSVDRLDDTGRRSEPSYRKAVELKALGLYEFAAMELEGLDAARTDLALQLALAELYGLSGRTREAEAILNRRFKKFIEAGSRDPAEVPREFWRVVYPFSFRPEIEQSLAEAGLSRERVDPYLVAALILQESRFQPTVVSRTGAIGLMQLMPRTAEWIAGRNGLGPVRRTDLFDPWVNIRLGIAHLARRLAEFGGERVPALCSYNADIKVVRKWWSERPPGMLVDEFIETIPYGETRLYVKKILAHHANYRWIYSEGF